MPKPRDWSPMVDVIMQCAGDDHTVDDFIRVAEKMGFNMDPEDENTSDLFWEEFRLRLIKAFGNPNPKPRRKQ